jgi:hypothetical protein
MFTSHRRARPTSRRSISAATAAALALGAAGCAASDQSASNDAVDVATTTTIPAGATTTSLSATTTTALPTAPVTDDPPTEVLSAYLGALDLPLALLPNLEDVSGCDLEAQAEGLPVVLSRPVDGMTLDAGDFVVTTASGDTRTPTCATLAPADDDDELQTVLLVGELGSADDRPSRVSIVGELSAVDGTDLNGLDTSDVSTFEDGPEVVLAKTRPAQEHCSSLGSTDEIQTTWQGGVTGPRGSEVGADQLDGFIVTDAGGAQHQILGFDDLGDGDNYIVVCVPASVVSTTLTVRAATLFDPTNNPNPNTNATVTEF